MSCQFSQLKMQTQGRVSHFNPSKGSGVYQYQGKDYRFSQSDVVRPDLRSGDLKFGSTHYKPASGAEATADVSKGSVIRLLVWDVPFFEWRMRPYRLIIRKGNEPRYHPRFHTANGPAPEYHTIWYGYNPGKDERTNGRSLYDMGISAMYFEQYDPALEQWVRVEDPR